MTAACFYNEIKSSLVKILLLPSVVIIFVNCLLGIFCPILDGLQDEITYFDTLWRVSVGQRFGVDFHNPEGFGPYYLGALLWHWLGPHYYVMRLAIALVSLSIAVCGCIVAKRTFVHRPDLALLFCVTLAFQLSGPTIYEFSGTSLSMAGFYNRHIVSAIAVLFLQTFGSESRSSRRENAIEVALAACLLNIMFLTKLSGLLLGLMILLAGCLFRGRIGHRLLNLCATLVAFAVITAIEFRATGLELTPIIQDYELAAHARLAYSIDDIARAIFSGPLVGSVALLVLFAVSQRPREPSLDFQCIAGIIGSYAACQVALNMTNWGTPNMWLAPAAAGSLAVCGGVTADAQQLAGVESWWRRFAPSRLAEISVREAIPVVIFMLVLVPQIIASIVGMATGTLVSLGIEGPTTVITGGIGVSLRSLSRAGHDEPVYVKSLNEGSRRDRLS